MVAWPSAVGNRARIHLRKLLGLNHIYSASMRELRACVWRAFRRGNVYRVWLRRAGSNVVNENVFIAFS